MTKQDKSVKFILVGGISFLVLFAVLIFMVNHWLKRSLQEMQNQTTQTPASTTPLPEVHKKDTRPVAEIMGQTTAEGPAAVSVKQGPRSQPIEKEAPILDKFLNE